VSGHKDAFNAPDARSMAWTMERIGSGKILGIDSSGDKPPEAYVARAARAGRHQVEPPHALPGLRGLPPRLPEPGAAQRPAGLAGGGGGLHGVRNVARAEQLYSSDSLARIDFGERLEAVAAYVDGAGFALVCSLARLTLEP